MKKNLLILALISGFSSACGTLPKGTVIRVPSNTDNGFFRSKIAVYNNAGKTVTIIPLFQGQGLIQEYRIGNRNSWCFWLCRKKIATRIFALCHGQHLIIPLLVNTDYYSAPASIVLKVYQDNQPIGTYLQCISIPPGRPVRYDLVFGPEELKRLKSGDSGTPCRSYW